MSETTERLAEVEDRIAQAARASGRTPDAVKLVAVAKTATESTLLEAWEAGQRHFGHNRIQVMKPHVLSLPQAQWHFLGPLQRNKALEALQMASFIHSIGTTRIVKRLEFLLSKSPEIEVSLLAQVNLTPEDGRFGCTENDLPGLLEQICAIPGVSCEGLMTMGPHGATESTLRSHFAKLRNLGKECSKNGQLPTHFELSMGMTEDYSIAIEEGATLVRVGRAIFPVPKEKS